MAKILLVDDSRFQRKNVSKLLVGMGHEVSEAENGEVGLQMVESFKPDLIITDLLMPVMDGLSVLLALRKRGCKTPAIVVSADIQESTRQECMQLGAKAFLTKPVNAADIEATLKEVVAASQRERA